MVEKVASPINKYTTCKNARGDGSAEPLAPGQGEGTNGWPSLPENYLIGLEGKKRRIPIESGLRDRRGYFFCCVLRSSVFWIVFLGEDMVANEKAI